MANALIEDYALIGDCETAALVGRDGSIDWLCWPRFDSDALFAKILGTAENGRWRISPDEHDHKTTRRYLPGTLVLETRHETPSGVALVLDFMPPRGACSDIVRLVVGISGAVPLRSDLTLRFDYGKTVPWVARLDDGALRAIAGPDMVVLRSPVPSRGENLHTLSDFTVRAGERIPFVLTHRASHLPIPDPIDPEQALADTQSFWTEWSSRYEPAALDGDVPMPAHWLEAGRRSLITLKALTYAPTGGIVAAPTTSLPEWIGSSRNWDYRFCWLRDSALTLFALMDAGYKDEAEAWRDWLVRAIAGTPDQLQIMFGIAGERRLDEWEAEWLPGFAKSAPVRIGNAASDQIQLDVYGEVMHLLHQARLGGIKESEQAWAMQRGMLARLAKIWREPDSSIWEIRGDPRHYVFSKLMAWVAFDRAIKSAEQFGLPHAPLHAWRTIREEIHVDIMTKGWSEAKGSFAQSYGSDALDASLLLLPVLGFLPKGHERVTRTVEAIEADLLQDGFVLRYRTEAGEDNLPPGEGAFLACSFWLVEALIQVNRIDEARAFFERLLALQNDLGLLAEEYDPVGKRQLGNFPQAFSHVALVNAGHRLADALRGPGQYADKFDKG